MLRNSMLYFLVCGLSCLGLSLQIFTAKFLHKHRAVKSDLETTTAHDSTTTTAIPSTRHQVCIGGQKRNLLFLKTHKTASSTVQNILMRYAWANDLIIGLPIKGNLFGYYGNRRFSKSLVQPIPPGRQVNMLVHHMIFDYEKVSSALPADSVYFTILRDPATHFESVYNYFGMSKRYGDFEEFVFHPERHFNTSHKRSIWWFVKNGITYDLGFDNLNETDAYLKHIVLETDKIFNFVMIAEYFDISLLILKEILCWEMKDIVYLSANARNQSTVQHVTGDVSKKIREWNKADTTLYNYYNKTLWKRVEKYGKERLQRDLQTLKKLKDETEFFCVEKERISSKDIEESKFKIIAPPEADILQFKLRDHAKNNDSCVQMILPEFRWLVKLSQHQNQRTEKTDMTSDSNPN